MKIIIKQSKVIDSYDLYVNGKIYIKEESMQVCDNVKEALENNAMGISEADEIAENILSIEK